MTKKQEKEFNKLFEEKLQEQFLRGLLQDSKDMCGVILDMTKKCSNNNHEAILGEIKSFCEKSLALPEQK